MADPGDYHRGLTNALQMEKAPTHQAVDLMTIMPHVNATGILVHTPVTHLSGSEVTEVSAFGACLVDPEIAKAGDVDTCIITLRFANGALGVIDNSRQAVYGYDQRVVVFGSKGMINAENETANNTTYYTASAVTKEKPLYFFLERYNEAYIEEEREFVDACLHGTQTPVGAIDGLQPVLIGLAAKKSQELGGVPVKVEAALDL